MAVIRRRHNAPFTTIRNALFEDESLSAEAIGVQAYLLSRPQDWTVHLDQLRSRFSAGDGAERKPMGRHKIDRIMHELIDGGWIEREQVRGETGAFDGWEYVVLDVPKHVEVALRTSSESVSFLPHSDYPHTAEPNSDNPNTYKGRKGNKDSPLNPPLTKGGTALAGQAQEQEGDQGIRLQPEAPRKTAGDPPEPDKPDDDTLDRFDELWRRAPDKSRAVADKADALRRFAYLTLLEQQQAVRSVHEANGKALHRWLRDERWQNSAEVGAIKRVNAMVEQRKPRVFVREDSPEWLAWLDYERRQGKLPRVATDSSVEKARGWWFPSKSPPCEGKAA